ncbi:uncharacterized protein LOC141622217 [Silene latifolia]|uniref:uncharacterized protein LOC141622217 n=1 Tax=Silene latifolia TaxID=37657 RepID=UPI003D76EB41
MTKKRSSYVPKTAKYLHLEKYDAFYTHHFLSPFPPPSVSVHQLNEILRFHGYFELRLENKRKAKILEALSEIDTLVNPRRSTLNEALPSCNPGLTLDEVNADLTALNWAADFKVESLQSVSFATNETDVHDIGSSGRNKERRGTRVRKDKVRKVFDAIHLTKPRSRKNCFKRKCLSDILNIGHVFDRLS